MKHARFPKTLVGFGLVLFISMVLSCSGENQESLYLYNWSDYIDEELVEQFSNETGIKVVTDYFDSNESMYAKIRSGADGYDIAFPTSYMVEVMKENDMIQDLDHSRLPGLKNLDPRYLTLSSDPEMTYSVPYMVSTTGIGVLSSKLNGVEALSWDIFANPVYSGRMTMLNDIRETIGAGLKYLGYSYNSVDKNELEEARDLLISWKKNLAKFENDQYKNGLVSEEFYVSQGYSGDILQVQEENENIVFMIPKEGTSISIDNMVILKNAKNQDAAYKFIDFMLRSEVAAANIEYVYYLAPNVEAYKLLDKEILENPAIYIPEAILSSSEILLDLGDFNTLYSSIWDDIKNASTE